MGSRQRLEIDVDLALRGYRIVVTAGELSGVGEFARARVAGTKVLVVADEHTQQPFAETVARALSTQGFEVGHMVVPAGEQTKSLEWAGRLYDRLIEMAADRQTLVVPVGGGVVGDLGGFVAATFARGLPIVQVPTSLLAQIDSSVGGKVAVNHHAADGRITKNMIGAFHQPVGVFVDTETLHRLPSQELRAGLAEVVKYGVILDAELFGFLEAHVEPILALDPDAVAHVVGRCCRLKADVVESDEREESNYRVILNYGHTFAHAIEAVTAEFRHGEAVAMGMVAASRLAERLGRVSPGVTRRQIELLCSFGLPTVLPALDPDPLLHAMARDKKTRGGRLRFVLPKRIGKVELVEDVNSDVVRAVVESAAR